MTVKSIYTTDQFDSGLEPCVINEQHVVFRPGLIESKRVILATANLLVKVCQKSGSTSVRATASTSPNVAWKL